jgi:preprotein translocase subunit YajC
MEEERERKIDFKKYTSSPVSKMYLLRIVFYIVLLVVVLSIFFSQRPDKHQPTKSIETIENVTIDVK